MKLDLEMAVPQPAPSEADPFALGWRYTGRPGPDWRVPLTEEDLLFPQEDDFVVNNQAHHDERHYLMSVFRERIAGREGLRVFGDHMIDFGVKGLRILGPDIIVLNGEPREWNPRKALLPVKDMAARPLFVVELTSPTTRSKDLIDKPKLFYRAGVPIFVLIDLAYGGGKHPNGIVAFQAGPTEYEALPPDKGGRVWLEVVEVFLAAENDRVSCYDAKGKRIEDYSGLAKQVAAAEAEKRKADRSKRRADAEKQRADAAEEKLKELEAELKRLRGDTK